MSQILGDFLNIQGLNCIFVRSFSFNNLIEQTFDWYAHQNKKTDQTNCHLLHSLKRSNVMMVSIILK